MLIGVRSPTLLSTSKLVVLEGPWGKGKKQGHYHNILGFRLDTAPPTNSWILIIIGLYIALNRTPNINCYWGGAVPKV